MCYKDASHLLKRTTARCSLCSHPPTFSHHLPWNISWLIQGKFIGHWEILFLLSFSYFNLTLGSYEDINLIHFLSLLLPSRPPSYNIAKGLTKVSVAKITPTRVCQETRYDLLAVGALRSSLYCKESS